MLRTYKAVLRGNRVGWIDASPELANPVQVYVTLLDNDVSDGTARAQQMAAALESIARAGGLSGIPDPDAWQPEVRRDRSLIGRDG